jgi:hypothetical protein
MRKLSFVLLLAVAACQMPLRSAEAGDYDPLPEACAKYGFAFPCTWKQIGSTFLPTAEQCREYGFPSGCSNQQVIDASEARIAAICYKYGLPAGCTEYQLERAMLEKRALERAAMPPPSVTCKSYWDYSYLPDQAPVWMTKCD